MDPSLSTTRSGFCWWYRPPFPQNKIQSLATTSQMTGVTIKREITKSLRMKSEKKNPIKLNNEAVEDVSSLTCLGSVIAMERGTEQDVKGGIGNARAVFILWLRPVRISKEIFLTNKVRIFNTNVKTVSRCLEQNVEEWQRNSQIKFKPGHQYLRRSLEENTGR